MTGQLQVGDGATLTYRTRPAAPGGSDLLPFVFQHGMGGDTDQPLGYVGDRPPVPVVCLSARGHAPSDDLTDPAAATFDRFADDVIALADELGLDRFVIGGISLGAGTALNLATRHPDRVAALVLCRPAWLDHPQAEPNQAAYREIADLLDGAADDDAATLDTLAASYREAGTYRQVQAGAPAAAASLLGQITRPRARQNTLLLRSFPAISPTADAATWARISVPTLVIGHRDDPFHPYEIAENYATAIPTADLVTVPSKDADPAGFSQQTRTALHAFLTENSRR